MLRSISGYSRALWSPFRVPELLLSSSFQRNSASRWPVDATERPELFKKNHRGSPGTARRLQNARLYPRIDLSICKFHFKPGEMTGPLLDRLGSLSPMSI